MSEPTLCGCCKACNQAFEITIQERDQAISELAELENEFVEARLARESGRQEVKLFRDSKLLDIMQREKLNCQHYPGICIVFNGKGEIRGEGTTLRDALESFLKQRSSKPEP